MLALDDVSKAYKLKGVHKVILDRVSFSFPEGRNVAIMGRNGAGKSTLMRLLAGAEQPDSGRVLRSLRVSWPLGFAGGFNGSMTGMENVRFVARVYGQDTEAVIDYVRDFSELGRSLDLPIRTYSSGMKARLAFGLSMAIDFDCYLIDEITAVGDERFKRKSQAIFKEKLSNSRVIMISHSIGAIREYCDCGILLESERIIFFDTANQLISAYIKLQNENSLPT
ncbi:Polysialic acid transport ATP-binding protein KpsT [uncultured Pleomorphomonas sp.]|uniref:Polysialic acid transport ATP-binding protein KpsT n=1 Tax=uncultured Pleomorphomonas sp. TaxID=442121 RepID=A0A212LFV6_9HYPH|nr:ABC transporter ATP-binding protein [uncultured Pleomorphomonas sp.]SCM76456.1 Polysialic acid transport ATP-binding protein KpsT [uncultured Pleomorphomonas sp.]